MFYAQLPLKPAIKKETYQTGRIGTIHASFQELIDVLGEPHDCTHEGEWYSGDKKIRAEWAFMINGDPDLIFTVYDYKSRHPIDKLKQWSLGGKDPKVKDPLSLLLKVE